MRVNERQQELKSAKEWQAICEESIDKFHKDILVNGDIRYIAKEPIEHGAWIIYSIAISAKPWACISDNVEYLEEKAKQAQEHQEYLNRKYLLKPIIKLISNIGNAFNKLHSEDSKLNNQEYELMLGYYQLWECLHMRTKGMIRNTLISISKSKQILNKGKGSQELFRLLKLMFEIEAEAQEWANTSAEDKLLMESLFSKPIKIA